MSAISISCHVGWDTESFNPGHPISAFVPPSGLLPRQPLNPPIGTSTGHQGHLGLFKATQTQAHMDTGSSLPSHKVSPLEMAHAIRNSLLKSLSSIFSLMSQMHHLPKNKSSESLSRLPFPPSLPLHTAHQDQRDEIYSTFFQLSHGTLGATMYRLWPEHRAQLRRQIGFETQPAFRSPPPEAAAPRWVS